MAARCYLHLPPGALHAPDYASVTIQWWRVSVGAAQESTSDYGSTTLGEFVAQQSDSFAIILSAADVHLSQVELTRQQARHLEQVLPFLLEEKVIDEPDALYCVSHKLKSGAYQLAAIQRKAINLLMAFFEEQGAEVEQLLVDGALLNSEAPCFWRQADGVLLVSTDTVAVVPNDLMEAITEEADYTELTSEQARSYLTQAAKQKPLNLMRPQWRTQKQNIVFSAERRRWTLTLAVAAALLAIICVSYVLQFSRYNSEANYWQQQSASLFEQLFPNDKATVRLRSQFQGYLTRLTQTQDADANFVSMMMRVGDVTAAQKGQGMVIERIQFEQQSGQIMLDVEASSYDALQALRDALQSKRLTAEISVAKTNNQKVTARLKVEQSS